ncbi:MAG TPA: hypothetical protein VIP46_20840 [Pyrinomonadaceae bacterium]
MSRDVTNNQHEPLSSSVAELGRRYASGDVTRERLDARLLELRICPELRRSRSRALPALPPPVTFHSLEPAAGGPRA